MIKITPVRYGETTLKESWIFRGGDPERRRPISLTVFLIEMKTKRSWWMRDAILCPALI